jgi:hypothetical protein
MTSLNSKYLLRSKVATMFWIFGLMLIGFMNSYLHKISAEFLCYLYGYLSPEIIPEAKEVPTADALEATYTRMKI